MTQARLILRKVIETDPRNAEAWLAMSEVVERPEHAMDCLQRALALDRGNVRVGARLAELKARAAAAREGSPGAVPGLQKAEISGAVKGESEIPMPVPQRMPPKEVARTERPVAPQAGPGRHARPGAEVMNATKAAGATSTTGSKLERGLIVLAGLIGILLICLTVSVLGQRVLGGMAQATPTQESVVAVLIENVLAANAEDLRRYMATIHPDSPSYAYTETTLASAFELYDLGYELTKASVVEQGSTHATVSFVLTTRKINGPAFRDNRVSGMMYLRKDGGVWKIYDQSIENIEYLN